MAFLCPSFRYVETKFFVTDSSGETQVFKREKKTRGGLTQSSNKFKKVKKFGKGGDGSSDDDDGAGNSSNVNVAFKGTAYRLFFSASALESAQVKCRKIEFLASRLGRNNKNFQGH